jgi:DNA-binding transcriptional MerR regulator
MTITRLADATGIGPRTVRFYIRRKLLPAPFGRGRAARYSLAHLHRLRPIIDLRNAGHSLDSIARMLRDESAPAPSALCRPALATQHWMRLPIAGGLELHFDAVRHNPDAELLQEIQRTLRSIFAGDDTETDHAPQSQDALRQHAATDRRTTDPTTGDGPLTTDDRRSAPQTHVDGSCTHAMFPCVPLTGGQS